MSSAAKFLLEFEARGDQEVVNKIKAVGQAGTEAATELQGLQGIEDPFAPIAEGADAAVAPIEGVGTAATDAAAPIAELGTAATDTVTPLEDMGTATSDSISIMEGAGTATEGFSTNLGAVGGQAEAATGGLDTANTLVGDFGDTADTTAGQTGGLTEGIKSVTGSIAAIGGAIGTAVGAYFRLQDAQLKVQKASGQAARAAETYRKAEEAIDKLLATATGNYDNIAAARQRLADAQARVNQLQNEGIISGEEYEAANAELQASQAALAAEFAKGGGDVSKLTAAMEKAEISAGKVATTSATVEKAQRQQNQAIMENVFAYTSLAGSAVQIVQGINKARDAMKASNTALKETSSITGLAVGGFGKLSLILGIAVAAIVLFLAVYDKIRPTIIATANAIGGASKAFGDWMLKVKEFVNNVRPMEEQEKAINKELGKGTSIKEGAATATKKLGDNAALAVGDLLRSAGASEEMISSVTGIIGASEAAGGAIQVQAKATAGLGTASMKASAELENMREQSDGLTAAFASLISPTTELHASTVMNAEAVSRLTDEDVKSVAAMEQRTRNLLVMSSGVENARLAEIQYQQALTAMTASLVKDTDEKNANARATLALANTNVNAQNTLATLREEYAQSVDKLADLNTTMSSTEGYTLAVATAVNESKAALMEQSIELDAAIESADSYQQAQLRLANAQKEGTLEIQNYVNGLDEAAVKEEAMVAELERSGAVWSDIPPFVEKNIDTLKLFGVEAKVSGEAAREAADMAAEAWRKATSEMGKEIDSLADIFMKGGDKMDESIDKFFGDMEGKLGRSLSGAEKAAVKSLAKINESAQNAINEWQFGQLMGQSIEAGGADLAAAYDNLASKAEEKGRELFQRAAEIIRQDPSLAAAVNEIIGNIGKTAPDLLMKQLNALVAPANTGGKQVGTAIGTGISDGFSFTAAPQMDAALAQLGLKVADPSLQQKAAEAGKGAGISLSQEFAAAGVHIAAVIEGIKQNIATIATGTTGIVIPVTVDTAQAGQQLNSIVSAASSLTATIKSAVDQSGAGQGLNQIVSAANSLTAIIKVSYQVTGTPPVVKPITTTITYSYKVTGKPPSVKPLKSFINYAYKITGKAPNPKEIKRFISYAYRITNKIPNPPEIKRWITYKYRVQGSPPNPPNLNRTITYRYRTVGSRPAKTGMHETLAEDTLIQAHKGERVDIKPAGTETLPNIYRTITGGVGRRDVTLSVPVFLDGRVITRIVRRHLAEDVTAGM